MQIQEIIVEPEKIYTGSTFRLKVKVQDDYFYKKRLITEDGKAIVTEDSKKLRTEWGV